jgi:hypothetical protein
MEKLGTEMKYAFRALVCVLYHFLTLHTLHRNTTHGLRFTLNCVTLRVQMFNKVVEF